MFRSKAIRLEIWNLVIRRWKYWYRRVLIPVYCARWSSGLTFPIMIYRSRKHNPFLKTLLIVVGVRGMEMGCGEEKKQTVYLESRMCIFISVLLICIFYLLFLCICIELNFIESPSYGEFFWVEVQWTLPETQLL